MVGNSSNSWFYDEVLRFYQEKAARFSAQLRQTAVDLKKASKRAKKLDSLPVITSKLRDENELVKQEMLRARSATELFRIFLKNTNEIRARIDNSKVFRIGPATLESLLNSEPDRYDYIENAQLPFPSMFFDAQYGVKIRIDEDDLMLHGIQFSKEDHSLYPELKLPYHMISYMKEGDEIIGCQVTFDPLKKDLFYFERGAGLVARFDTQERKVTLVERPGLFDHIKDKNIQDFLRLKCMDCTFDDGKIEIEYNDSFDHFRYLANLCVNLVNYINAENITIVERHGPKGPPRGPRQEPRQNYHREFYVVKIEGKEIYEPEATGNSWTLTDRICVRGHVRKYRNSDGNIRKTTWIPPHVKGPEGAPFRNQRYEYMARQIELERRMEQEENS